MSVTRYFRTGRGRQYFKKIYLWLIYTYFKLFDNKPSDKPCVVFAPHQDDETLGCGGTILKKISIGASVKIVFLTDGNNSHKHLSSCDLKEIRREEAISACKVLGITVQDVIFLDQEDGKLDASFEDAVTQVANILKDSEPEEVYIPYIKDHHPDHKSTNKIVVAAINKVGKMTTVFEYPTWFWDHWPIVNVPAKRKKDFITQFNIGLKSAISVLYELRYSVSIVDELEQKRKALDEHMSQMRRLNDNDKWFILNDVSDGEWLECFFREREVFHKYMCP